MVRKYFPFDKNYILKEAQYAERSRLLLDFLQKARDTYLQIHNPLGLVDDTILRITAHKSVNAAPFFEFYDELAAIYRYYNGENQLEILFDGRDHFDKYSEEWATQFQSWYQEFFQHPLFLKNILSMDVFMEDDRSIALGASRLKHFLTNYFDIKVYRYKGIMKIA